MPTIEICMGSSCFSRGNSENLRIITEYLQKNHLTGLVKPMGHLCESQCSEGPNLIINGRMYHRVNAASCLALLNERLKPKTAK